VDEDDFIDDCPRTNDDEVRWDLETLGPGDEAVLFITIELQEDRVSTDVNNGEDNVDEKVCVKHYAGKSGKYNYIYISEQGYENGHRRHGDRIVDAEYCKKTNGVEKYSKDNKDKKKSGRTSKLKNKS
jgi:hypothetical protein